ncbi:hypothetical protein NBRC110019_04050 [Neptunitalea chrysea]|uniref:Cupin fold metalloprotein WbuC cupin domain-containing protein n=1 Tax=Neptunitalea chrysea TaxID=1647581 RepID=A0A9W6EU81_9FLAO|nr:WbuC family cupin fold metalloprotein [Neptunitalea chrysea]GLB51366.1 hypothetical protein NBRC110019_04050 [Neptunitalea chrysea]
MEKKNPAATTPPTTDLTYLTSAILEAGIEISKDSPRKRVIVPLHKTDDNKLHRMFNVMQPGTYIRPHYHKNEQKCESVVVLKGAIMFITFHLNGTIDTYQTIKAGSDIFGVDLEPSIIHSFIVLEKDTVIYEVKPGPYIKSTDKDFMLWSPEEGTTESLEYLEKLKELTKV